jgi:lipopolysaccharide/colanic/teichoic acid biosynthesis glycosyltransferase
VLFPLLLVVAFAIRLKLGKPVLFVQPRAGLKGRTFLLRKFRSMNELRDAQGKLLPDNQRLTAFGAFLRRTSIDELPSLWNVLIGDMSLVGPRPLLVEYLPRYTPEQMRRHDVRPGITGLAQINGRRNLVFSKRLELDTRYVETHSWWLDAKILFLTLYRSGDQLHAHQEIGDVDDLGLHNTTVASARVGVPSRAA